MASENTAAEAEKKLALMEQMNRIQSFSGTNPYYQLNLFKKDFNDWATFFGWDESEKFFILKKKLEGKACQIYSIHEDNVDTSEKLFQLLTSRLVPQATANEKLQALWDFKQSPDMPVEDFISLAKQKAKSAAEAHNCTREKINEATEEWLLAALKNNVLPQYRREILRKNPKTSAEFADIAKIEEITFKETSKLYEGVQCNAVISKNNDSNLIKLIEQMSTKIELLNNKISNLESNQAKVDCPPQTNNDDSSHPQNKVIICKQCGRWGHGFINCRTKPQNYYQNYENNSQNNFRGNNYRGRGYWPRGNSRGAFTASNNEAQSQESQTEQPNNNQRGHFRGRARSRPQGSYGRGFGRGNNNERQADNSLNY